MDYPYSGQYSNKNTYTFFGIHWFIPVIPVQYKKEVTIMNEKEVNVCGYCHSEVKREQKKELLYKYIDRLAYIHEEIETLVKEAISIKERHPNRMYLVEDYTVPKYENG